MKKTLPFFGTATALVTPFDHGEIDYGALARLIEMQLASAIPALVIGGTTGEAATLCDREREQLYRFAVKVADGRCKIILGTGTNDTRVAISHTELAEDVGADAVLTVTPYYNKGTKRGIIQHYEAIAAATSLPVILYNVPSRTGVNLTLDVLCELAEVDNIVAIKEASDSLDRLVDICAKLGDSLYLYSGNDTQIYPSLALGARGIISVASNIVPSRLESICRAFRLGEHERARSEANALLPLFHALFLDTNPVPVKHAMELLGMCRGEVRLPLAPPDTSTRKGIEEALRRLSLI